MDFLKNLPFFCIVLCMAAGMVTGILNGKNAKRLTLFVVTACTIMSSILLWYVVQTGESFVYIMGHHPAPWGNEIRAGILEALMAVFFCVIMLLSLLGGLKQIFVDVEEKKVNIYFIMTDLLLASLLALIYTNDIFTGYVFIEINTIAACGLIMSKQNGRTIVASTKYMVMSLLGSGLTLISITLLYDITGHLLMSNIKEAVANIYATGQYAEPLTIVIALFAVGLAIKSALFPFHSWLPDAYGYSTASSAAMLSSLVSKGYIFLLIKIIYRVIGFEVVASHRIMNILFVFGLIGMILGSVRALGERDIRRMIAYSSIAQIGYIYMGIGLGTKYGVHAAIFHILSHAASKALLFISANGLSRVSGDSKLFVDLKGSGFRNKIAGIGFMVGSLSMVGIPLFAGFISKVNFAAASVVSPTKMIPTLICLAISTVLNAMYFIRATIIVYTPVQENEYKAEPVKNKDVAFVVSVCLFVVLNFVLGVGSQPIMNAIRQGIAMFG